MLKGESWRFSLTLICCCGERYSPAWWIENFHLRHKCFNSPHLLFPSPFPDQRHFKSLKSSHVEPKSDWFFSLIESYFFSRSFRPFFCFSRTSQMSQALISRNRLDLSSWDQKVPIFKFYHQHIIIRNF